MNSSLSNLFSNKKYKVVPIMKENADLIYFEYELREDLAVCQIVIRKPPSNIIDELDQLERGEYIAK